MLRSSPRKRGPRAKDWMPACAGMSGKREGRHDEIDNCAGTCVVRVRHPGARRRLEFLSSPVRAAVCDLAWRKNAERGNRKDDQRRTESTPAPVRYLAD